MTDAERKRAWYVANREKMLEKARQYRLANREKKREQDRQYRLANLEKKRETDRQYYLANKEKLIEYQRQYCLVNLEKVQERRHQHYLDNQETISERQRQYWLANREKMLERRRQSYLANREKMLEQRRERQRVPCPMPGCTNKMSTAKSTMCRECIDILKWLYGFESSIPPELIPDIPEIAPTPTQREEFLCVIKRQKAMRLQKRTLRQLSTTLRSPNTEEIGKLSKLLPNDSQPTTEC